MQQEDFSRHSPASGRCPQTGAGATQQRSVARIFPFADGLALDVPAQPHTPDRHQCQQQPAAVRVALAECGGDGGDRDETHAPRDVDDVVPPDAPADGKRDRMHHGERHNRGTGYLGQILQHARMVHRSSRANVHW